MITRQYKINSRNYNNDKNFFKNLAELYPKGGCVIQFPLTGFPLSTRHEYMDSYNHARPYIHSDANMRYSWPSLSNAHRSWQNHIESLKEDDLVEAVTMSGFNVALIDKFGYRDKGTEITSYFTNMGAKTAISNERYLILDLKECILKQSKKFKDNISYDYERKRFIQNFVSLPSVIFGKGFFAQEKNSIGQTFNWSKNRSQIIISNNTDAFKKFKLKYMVASYYEGELSIEEFPEIKTTSLPKEVDMTLLLKPKEQKVINLFSTSKAINREIDARELVFYLMNLKTFDEN
jgi:hypothetical protein